MEIHDYTWIFAVGMVVAFIDAFGIGANDVANSFATSVSAGSLTLAQACIVACFTEFGGAVLLGAATAETIKGGILSVSYYVDQPEMLMLAMLCAIVGSATWVLTATRFGWPVSSTHSVVGAVIGTGISAFGFNSITWGWDGVAQIIASWFISPVAAGCVAAVIYSITKYAILRRVDSFKWGIRLVPIYFFFTAGIESFYIIFKAPGGGADKMHIGLIVGIALIVAVVCALFCQFFLCPWAVRRIKGKEDLKWYHIFVTPFLKTRPMIEEPADTEVDQDIELIAQTSNIEKIKDHDGNGETEVIQDEDVQQPNKQQNWFIYNASKLKSKFLKLALNGIKQDVRNLDNKKLQNVHAHTELFEDDAEYLFRFLQVITACMASFAHGSNDVSNAIGPISSIYEVWSTARIDVSGKTPIPIWILVYGGVGIDLGLTLLGYRVMRTMGNNITYFTPSRGFCAELSAALTVLTCSQIGLPVSTTHCITGASAAIGLCNTKGYKAVNWKALCWCFFSWFITLPCAGLVAGLLFAICSNSPKFI
ncbi:phosphate transporter [Cokeromyces recurvatus]|uniref:phosphate transporter n=1 Tax=Cokeromyces recurvatus TaxID=90255 RepID=UPI0022211A71|nr:phosphate transporter [Cokeromyces recurvatus]KAI7906280.1 phosphate transporter [Cokeromyces recurvatus]